MKVNEKILHGDKDLHLETSAESMADVLYGVDDEHIVKIFYDSDKEYYLWTDNVFDNVHLNIIEGAFNDGYYPEYKSFSECYDALLKSGRCTFLTWVPEFTYFFSSDKESDEYSAYDDYNVKYLCRDGDMYAREDGIYLSFSKCPLYNILGCYEKNMRKKIDGEYVYENLIDDAKKYFGTTQNWKFGFYINPDGTILDGSGMKLGNTRPTQRAVDHREIIDVMQDDDEIQSGDEAMIKYMSEGAIRWMPEAPGFTILNTKEPTDAQYVTMRELINMSLIECDEFYVDIAKATGYRNWIIVDNFEYDDFATAVKVINDIKNYFHKNESVLQEDAKLHIDFILDDNKKKEFVDYMKSKYHVTKDYIGNACFLLEDGTYLNVGEYHMDCDDTVMDFLYDEKLVDDEQKKWGIIGESFKEHNLNAFHCGNNRYKYIAIYEQLKPTESQYKALKSFDDYYREVKDGYTIEVDDLANNKHKGVTILYNEDTDGFETRYGRKTDAESQIRSFYNTGDFIRESVNESFVYDGDEMSNEYDNEGNELTDAQIKFFKNSNVRNDKGQLIVCYHGSTSKNIDKFDEINSYGSKGIFFSDNNKLANAFTYDDGKVYSCYINASDIITIDAGKCPYNKISIDNKVYHIKDLIDEYIDKCDCLIINNIVEYDNYLVTDYIVFKSNLIKSTDNKNPTDSDNINEMNEDFIYESKEDIQKFKDKFGDDLYDRFLKSKDRLKNNKLSTDILYYVKNISKEDLINTLDSLYNLNKERDVAKLRKATNNKREIRGKYRFLGEYDGYLVYQPLDYRSSMDLGKNTGWCTTGRYGHYGEPDFVPSAKDAEKHFRKYTSKGVKFYYFLNKDTFYGEYAIALYSKQCDVQEYVYDKTTDEVIYINKSNYELFNAEDTNIEYKNDIIKIAQSKLNLDLYVDIDKEKTRKLDNGFYIIDNKLIKCYLKDSNITIPDSVTSIDDSVFCGFKNLTSITIPNSVTCIGEYAFSWCSSLTSVTMSNSVTSIGVSAFGSCQSLTSITIPDSINSIKECTFCDCRSLKSVIIPDSVTSIGYSAFSSCSSLKSITIPNSVTNIEEYAFYDCYSLKSIVIPSNVNVIKRYTFSYCTALQSVVIPNSVTEIGEDAFKGCRSLTEVTISDNVKSIGEEAFYNCSKLVINTNNQYVIDYCKNNDIKYKTDIKEDFIYEAKENIQKFKDKFGDELYTRFLKSKDRLKNHNLSTDILYYVKNTSKEDLVTVLDSLYDTSKERDVAKLRKVTGSEREVRGKYNFLGEYGEYLAYQPLDYLSSIDLGRNTGWCTTGRYEHYGDKNFIPSAEDAKHHFNEYTSQGVKLYYFLNKNTFYGEYAIALYPYTFAVRRHVYDKETDEIIYLNVTNYELFNSKDYNIWYENDIVDIAQDELNLDLYIDIDEGKTFKVQNGLYIKDNILIKCYSNDKKVIIPNNVTCIGDYVFCGCSSLTSITIPNSVTSICNAAFSGCSSLQSITIHDSVTEIGEGVFYDCKSLQSITIPSKVKAIKNYAFAYCDSLKSVIMPNGITEIGESAFSTCRSLTSITISDSVKSIGESAFEDCDKLTVHTNNPYVIDYCKNNAIKYETGIKEDFIYEDLMSDVIDKVENDLCSSDTPIDGPSYILPNGRFLKIWNSNIDIKGMSGNQSKSGKSMHLDVDGYIDKNISHISNSYYIQDRCVRVNNGLEKYLSLPREKMTDNQYKSLTVWLDEYFKNHDAIDIYDYYFSWVNQRTFNKNDYIVDEIIKAIKKFYSFGGFFESVDDFLYEDVEMSNEHDSEGHQLTKAQSEFFKNSKVRDDKGNLLVCYHGTIYRFDTFNKKSDYWFFTPNRQFAIDYAEEKAFDYEIDSGIDVKATYILGNKIFDINDNKCYNALSSNLPDTLYLGLNGSKISKDKLLKELKGIHTIETDSDRNKQLMNLKFGDSIPRYYTDSWDDLAGKTFISIKGDKMYYTDYAVFIGDGVIRDRRDIRMDDIIKILSDDEINRLKNGEDIKIKVYIDFDGRVTKEKDESKPSYYYDEYSALPIHLDTYDLVDVDVENGNDWQYYEMTYTGKEYISHLLSRLGYDVIKMRENDSITLMVKSTCKVKSISNKNPTNSDNINEDFLYEDNKVLYRGESNHNYSKRFNNNISGLFFSGDMYDDIENDYGEIHRYELDENAKIYKGTSSEYYCFNIANLGNKEDIKLFELLKSVGVPDDALVNYNPTLNNILKGHLYDCGDDSNVWFACTQYMAKRHLEKEGYDGAEWTYEDELIPHQYQIWNLNVIVSKDNVNESFLYEDDEFEKDHHYLNFEGNKEAIDKYLHTAYEWVDRPYETLSATLIDKDGRFMKQWTSKDYHGDVLKDLLKHNLISLDKNSRYPEYNYVNSSIFGDLGYVRLNSGVYGDYDYVQLPSTLNDMQIDAISQWIDMFYLGNGYTVIDTSCEHPHTYVNYTFELDDQHQADDYIRMLRRFKNSNKLVESFDEFDADSIHGDGIWNVTVTDEPERLANMCRRSNEPYRIFIGRDHYYYCVSAYSDLSHLDMMRRCYENGYCADRYDEYDNDMEQFLIFIPKNANVNDIEYGSQLGQDMYVSERVYDFGVFMVRSTAVYKDRLFTALGSPIMQIETEELDADMWDDYTYKGNYLLIQKDKTKKITYDDYMKLLGELDFPFNYKVESLNEYFDYDDEEKAMDDFYKTHSYANHTSHGELNLWNECENGIYTLIAYVGDNWIDDNDKIIKDNLRGYVEYEVSFSEKKIYIRMIQVGDKYKRQGIGTTMINDLKDRFPDFDIITTLRTDDGSKFFKKVLGEE